MKYKPKNYIVKKLPLSKQTTIDDHLAGIDEALENINSDVSYSGSTQIFTANENFLFGEVGFISNNRIIKSSAQSEVLGNCNVIALSDIRLGRRGLFGLYGCKVKNINWNFNLGQIFLSLTNGNITQDLNEVKFIAQEKLLIRTIASNHINQEAKVIIYQNSYNELADQKDLEILELLGGVE